MLIPVVCRAVLFYSQTLSEKRLRRKAPQQFFCASLAKRLTAIRAELGRMGRVNRGPTTLAALGGCRCWLGVAAVAAELTGVGGAAAADSQLSAAGRGRLGAAAVQNLPVLPVWPQLQVQPAGAAAGAGAGCAAACCWAPISLALCVIPPAAPAIFRCP